MRTQAPGLRQLAILLMLVAAATGSAQAASLALVPSTNPVTQNSPFTVDLVLTNDPPGQRAGLLSGSFHRGGAGRTAALCRSPAAHLLFRGQCLRGPGRAGGETVAGGKTVVSFDQTLLSYGSFTLTPGVPNLSFFSNPVVATNGNLKTVTFGFDYAPTGVVGKFTFTSLGSPGSLATLGLRDSSQTIGTFFNYAPTYRRIYPTLTGTQVTISAVPLPASVWLLGTGVGALAVRRRLRRAAG